jgi:hypothetical protein
MKANRLVFTLGFDLLCSEARHAIWMQACATKPSKTHQVICVKLFKQTNQSSKIQFCTNSALELNAQV